MKKRERRDAREADHHEVQPVPNVAQVREVVQNHAARHCLHHRLKRVDAREEDPEVEVIVFLCCAFVACRATDLEY